MNNYGFYIRKLVLRGIDREDAVLIFKEGLNTVTGASDTGKSFAFACIDFAMGSSEIPDIPNEAQGYQEVLLEIEEYKKGDVLTISRSLNENKAFLYYSAIKDIDFRKPIKISTKHNKSNSISKILLDLSENKYKTLLSSVKSGKTKVFSFRDFVHMTMASETKIVWKVSPIFTTESKKTTTRTAEIAAFYTVINGIDYPDIESKENVEITKARIRGKIELLQDLVVKLRQEITDDYKKVADEKIENVQDEILQIMKNVQEKKNKIELLEKDNSKLWNEYQNLKEEKQLLNELKNRFSLLRKNYDSDIERMEFICESQFYISQLVEVVCPICESKIESDVERNNYEQFEKAIRKEREKVIKQLKDLLNTVEDIQIKISEKSNQADSIKMTMDEINNAVENELKPVVSSYLERLNVLYSVKEIFVRIKTNELRTKQYETEVITLTSSLYDHNGNKGNLGNAGEEAINTFCSIIKELLVDWSFTKDTVTYNKEKKDIIVSNKNKSTFGKGSRAILNSAFLISIMLYSIELQLPHPKVVILDSPLTTFKEKDKLAGLSNEDVAEEIKHSFYNNLSKYNKGMQIIIFDNVEPKVDELQGINHQHFSGNVNIGRCGFIPQNKIGNA